MEFKHILMQLSDSMIEEMRTQVCHEQWRRKAVDKECAERDRLQSAGTAANPIY